MSTFKSRVRDDRGAVAVTVALLIVVLVSLAAFVVDLGYMYDVRRHLQSAADAAALAGCQALIETENVATAEAVAREYVAANQAPPAAAISIQSVAVNSGEGSVRVAVEQDTEQFFSRIFGPTSRPVGAAAKARKWKVVGARYVMPWGIPTIEDGDVDRVEVTLVPDDKKGTVIGPVTLGSAGARAWTGSVNLPSGAPPTGGMGYDAYVSIFNIFGVEEPVGDSKGAHIAGRVTVQGADSPFTSVSVSQDYAPSDQPVGVSIDVTTAEPQTRVDVKVIRPKGGDVKIPLVGSGTSWSVTLGQSQLDYDRQAYLTTYPLDIHVDNRVDGVVDAYAHVRRATHPVSGVEVSPGVVSPGGSTNVTVRLNEFDPTELIAGKIYPLKVAPAGVETGNFGELNLKGIQHNTPYCLDPCPADPPGVPLGNNVKDWVESGYRGGIHIGDIMPLSPGNSGWTDKVVEARIAKYGNFVVVPVVTKYEDKGGGSYEVIVRKFAAFKIVEIDGDSIWGEFVAYAANPAAFAEDPEGPVGVVYAARLVNP